MTKITMKKRVLEHLQKHGTITSWEAYTTYGCTRISEYIRQLREDNYDIKTIWTESKNRYGEKVRYGIYTLIKKKEGN